VPNSPNSPGGPSSPSSPKRRKRDMEVPLHRPKRILSHVSDEYLQLGNLSTALELRRHLRGGERAWRTYLSAERSAASGVSPATGVAA
jgi:hypothetical protein